jgi:hypothetical protein
MIKFFVKSVPAVFMSAMMLMGPAAPARANTTSTLILIGAAAAILGTAINVSNKNRQANSVVGYLPNGDRVYADGHAVASNGTTYYPGDQGQTLSCQNNRCRIAGTNGMYNGRRVGYENHHGPGGRVLHGQQGPPNWAPARGNRAHNGPPTL